MLNFKPPCVISVHGYFSNGDWQNELDKVLTKSSIVHKPFKYGFKVFKIFPYFINKDLIKFRDFYFNIVESLNLDISNPKSRPSIIAHSLGTWIVAKALLKYPEIKIDKIILCGSIVPADFDWFCLIIKSQVNTVICEVSDVDKIVWGGFIFTGKLNPCGRNGILQKSSFIKLIDLPLFDHSSFQYEYHYKENLIKNLFKMPHQLGIIHGRDTDESDIHNLFEQSDKIDQLTYPELYTEAPISIKTAMSWYRIEKNIWTFIHNIESKEVVAYINTIPVDDDIYSKFITGELKESEINAKHIIDFDLNDNFNLIILSIAIKKGVKNEENTLHKGRIAELLIMSTLSKISCYNENKVRLNKIGAVAWTAEGENLCKGFCMNPIGNFGTFPIYEIDTRIKYVNRYQKGNFMANWYFKQNYYKN